MYPIEPKSIPDALRAQNAAQTDAPVAMRPKEVVDIANQAVAEAEQDAREELFNDYRDEISRKDDADKVIELTREERHFIESNFMTLGALFTGLRQQERYFDIQRRHEAGEDVAPADLADLFVNKDGSRNELLHSYDASDSDHPIISLKLPFEDRLRHYQLVLATGDIHARDKRGRAAIATESGYKAAVFRELEDDGTGHGDTDKPADAPFVMLHPGARFPPLEPEHRPDLIAISRSIMGLPNAQMLEVRPFLEQVAEAVRALEPDRQEPYELMLLGHSLGALNNMIATGILLQDGDALNLELTHAVGSDGLTERLGVILAARMQAEYLDETAPLPDGKKHDPDQLEDAITAKVISLPVSPSTLATDLDSLVKAGAWHGPVGVVYPIIVTEALQAMHDAGLPDGPPRSLGELKEQLGFAITNLENHAPTRIINKMLADIGVEQVKDRQIILARAPDSKADGLFVEREYASANPIIIGFRETAKLMDQFWNLLPTVKERFGFDVRDKLAHAMYASSEPDVAKAALAATESLRGRVVPAPNRQTGASPIATPPPAAQETSRNTPENSGRSH